MATTGRLGVLLVLLSLLLAGCTGGAKDKNDASGGDGDAAGNDGGDVGAGVGEPDGTTPPVWNVGDWWQYQIDYTSGESYDAKLVVYADDGSHYLVTADDRDLILRSAISHYPTLGRVNKANFNGYIHDADVPFLRFPMQNGTWTTPYRDFTADWSTTTMELDTGKGPVAGFSTVMRDASDGLVRMRHGWSPVAKWFTNMTFDFDGVDEPDVVFTLKDWGTNHTGTFPVLEIVDRVHRPFPVTVLPTDPANPPGAPEPGPPPSDEAAVDVAGADFLWAMFGVAGGAGEFEFHFAQPASGALWSFPWRPTAAGSYFGWGEVVDPAVGDWSVAASGTTQGFGFMFCELYEVRTGSGTLPA